MDRTPQAKNTWVSVPEGDPLESILKDPRQELQLKMSKNANSLVNSRAWDRVTDSSKRLEELQRLKAEAEAELKHVERLQRLKVEIIEELTRLEELQRLKMKMPEKLAVSERSFQMSDKYTSYSQRHWQRQKRKDSMAFTKEKDSSERVRITRCCSLLTHITIGTISVAQ